MLGSKKLNTPSESRVSMVRIMEYLEALWGTLNLTKVKDKEIEIIEDEVEDVWRKGELCLIGKI